MSDLDIRTKTADEILPLESEVEKEANTSTNYLQSIFRVAKCERTKFYMMAGMYFFIGFVYSVLRDTKDALVNDIMVPGAGPFLKQFIIVVSIVIFAFIQFLVTKFSIGFLLRWASAIYVIYFLVFAFFLYPIPEFALRLNRYYVLDGYADGKGALTGLDGFFPLMLCLVFWPVSMFYITSELYGNIVLQFLFLSYSNDVCTYKQSLRFMPLYNIMANLGLFSSGLLMFYIAKLLAIFNYGHKVWLMKGVISVIGLCSSVPMLMQHLLETRVLNKPIFIVEDKTQRAVKAKVGYLEGIKQISKSGFLFAMSIMVFTYGFLVVFVDSYAKISLVKNGENANSPPLGYTLKISAITQMITASCVIAILLTPAARFTQIIGWTATSLISPIASIILVISLLALVTFNEGREQNLVPRFLNRFFDPTKLVDIKYEFWLGRIATAGMKVFKYAFFDVAKEAISMKVSKDQRAFYKSIYDGVFGKLGKGLGSAGMNFACSILNTKEQRNLSAIFFIFAILLVTLWFTSVFYLGPKYNKAVSMNTDLDLGIIGEDKVEVEK